MGDKDFNDRITEACMSGDVESMKSLLKDHPFIVNSYHKHPVTKIEYHLLHLAVIANQPSVLQWLCEQPVDINAKTCKLKDTSLMLACKDSNPGLVYILLKHKADLDIKSCKEKTALYFSIRHKHPITTRLLLEAGAKVNIPFENRFNNPLCVAMFEKQTTHLRLMLEHGADPNQKLDKTATRPLHVAAYVGHKIHIDLLLEHHAKINQENTSNATAMHFAALGLNLENMEHLMDHGANLFVRKGYIGDSFWCVDNSESFTNCPPPTK